MEALSCWSEAEDYPAAHAGLVGGEELAYVEQAGGVAYVEIEFEAVVGEPAQGQGAVALIEAGGHQVEFGD